MNAEPHPPPTQAELVAKLREMASQILTPSSKGKHFFNECADDVRRAIDSAILEGKG